MKIEGEASFVESHEYWLKCRIIFNAIMVVTGLIPVLMYFQHLRLSNLFGIAVWGVIANGLYSFGFVLECLIITRTKRANDFKRVRPLLMLCGTIAYALLTFLYAFVFFSTRYELSE